MSIQQYSGGLAIEESFFMACSGISRACGRRARTIYGRSLPERPGEERRDGVSSSNMMTVFVLVVKCDYVNLMISSFSTLE